jgi:hypothetical protein
MPAYKPKPPPPELEEDIELTGCEYFDDDREGTDRWGTPYKEKVACGTGFGKDQYVCPSYLEESCPGCVNEGNRIKPCAVNECDTKCDICGGGTRAMTMAVCGQERSELLPDTLSAEDEDAEFQTFRVDTWGREDDERLDPEREEIEFPFDAAPWFPVVRHNMDDECVGNWMRGLQTPWGEIIDRDGDPMDRENNAPFPAVLTTGGDFAWSVMRGRKRGDDGEKVGLRERLGAHPETKVFVHGQILDDVLDEIWENRWDFMQWCKEQGVDGMICPQFSTYPDLQNGMALYNVVRDCEWYMDCLEAGFDYVVFQHPGFQADWLTQECHDFVNRVGCKLVAISIQTHGARGGLIPESMKDHQRCGELYGPQVGFMHFGATTPTRMKMAATLLGCLEDEPRHRISFSNVVAGAGAAFYTLNPERVPAPSGWSKGIVFKHNCERYYELGNVVLERE